MENARAAEFGLDPFPVGYFSVALPLSYSFAM